MPVHTSFNNIPQPHSSLTSTLSSTPRPSHLPLSHHLSPHHRTSRHDPLRYTTPPPPPPAADQANDKPLTNHNPKPTPPLYGKKAKPTSTRLTTRHSSATSMQSSY